MDIVCQKRRQCCRAEDGLATLYLSYDQLCFTDEEDDCPAVTDTVLELTESFVRYSKTHLRTDESRQHGARHPIYASLTAVVHRADDRLICIELVFLAERFHHPIWKKHLLLYWGSRGTRVLNSRLLVGKRAKQLTVVGNLATDREGKVYELKKKYRN